MKKFFHRFSRDERGATAIEYGLIAGAMAVIIVAVFATFGNGLSDAFTNVTEQMQDSSTALTGAGFGAEEE